MDKRLIDLVENWDRLGWYERKIISWKCTLASHKIDNKQIASLFVLLVIIGIGLFENHINEAIVAYAVIMLLLFYFMAVDMLYQVIKTARGK